MNRTLALSLLLALSISVCSAQKDNSVAFASRALQQLIEDAQQNLADTNNNWENNEPLLDNQRKSAEADEKAINQDCRQREADIAATNNEITTCTHFIGWISKKIDDNIDRVKQLEQQKCDASKIYINSIKDHKIALSLIQYLKKAISERDSLSLVERNEILQRLTIFGQLYNEQQFVELMSKQIRDYTVNPDTGERSRTTTEIGTKHIDDNRGELNVAAFNPSTKWTWPQYKQYLLTLLDTLETEIRSQNQQAQDDEVQSGISLAEYKLNIEKENQDLNNHLADEKQKCTKAAEKLDTQTKGLVECNKQHDLAVQTVKSANTAYDEAKTAYQDRKSKINDEIGVLQYVVNKYKDSLLSEEGAYHERIDDYTTDKKFDNTYEGRDIDSYSKLNQL